MDAPLDDLPFRHHENLIGVADRVQPVGDDQQGFALAQLADSLLNIALIVRIYAAVASSRMTMGASFRMQRAMEILCFSPPERDSPPSPTTVS